MVPHLFEGLAQVGVLGRLGDLCFEGIGSPQVAVSMVALLIEIGIFPKGVGEPNGSGRGGVFKQLIQVGLKTASSGAAFLVGISNYGIR